MVTILFADNCVNIREFLKQELQEEGYRVVLARDGQEAIDLARSERPDLAILDIWMPRVSGLEAAEHIAAGGRDIPVILFTNNNDLCRDDPRIAFAAACIQKNGDLAALKRVIVALLAKSPGPVRLAPQAQEARE
jgi:CheY-like chemotaxis protein